MSEQKLSTIIYGDLSVTVHFDYQPEEPQTPTYPGSAPLIEMNAVYIGIEDIMPILSQKILGELADKCMESMVNDQ
ncbi:MAG: hypothetical protein V3V40_06075 [Nitrosomonadaceae bacterium]